MGGFTNGALLTLTGTPFGPLEDGDKGTLQSETHYELGYKGMLSDNLTWSFNVYNAQKENFVSTVQLSPLVGLPTLASDLAGTLTPFFTASFTPTYGPVYGAYFATVLANQYAGVAGMVAAAGALGVIESDQAPEGGEPSIMMGYKNFGKVNYWGFETGMKWIANDNLSLYGNYSAVSQTTFEKEDLGDLTQTGTWSLNHAAHRVKAGMEYDSGKFNFGMAYKYDGGFEANMGAFYSGKVDSRNLVDANLGFDINKKTSVGLNIINLMDTEYSIFPNMAQLGRQVILSLKHDF